MEDFKKTKYFKYLLDRFETLKSEISSFNEDILVLMNSKTDELGTVLKSHLIIEHYIDKYLLVAYPTITAWNNIRLTFNQKLELINNQRTILHLNYRSIKELNSLRNKFSHKLSYQIKKADLNEIRSLITMWYEADKRKVPEGLQLIEHYTIFICSQFNSMVNSINNETPELGIGGYLKWIAEMHKE